MKPVSSGYSVSSTSRPSGICANGPERVRDMGRKSIEEIEDVLERYNLRLGMLGKELDEYAGIENSVQDEEEEAKWEQRRYEIAKEVFIHHRLVANSAVYEADGLIRALRGMTHR